jgi:hypothetical protein
LTTLLDKWCSELKWKGWQTKKRQSATLAIDVSAPDGPPTTVLLLGAGDDPSVGPGERAVVLSIDDRPDIVPSPVIRTIFELRSRSYRGESFDLAEDLRDFLRRRTLPCGDDRPFRSILPGPFERLRGML